MARCQKCNGTGVLETKEYVAGAGYLHDTEGCKSCGGRGMASSKIYPLKRGSGSDGCFPSGTNISTPFGQKVIEEITVGDIIISASKSGKKLNSKVLEVKTHIEQTIWEIKLENGDQISTTPIHSFKSKNQGWLKALDIKSGDFIQNFEGEYSKVIYSSSSDKLERVFNLIVEDSFNYFADGFLVHSFSYFRKLRVFYWCIKGRFEYSKKYFYDSRANS